MSNPFVPKYRDLESGELTADIIRELWNFYQFMISDEEVMRKYEHWLTFEILKRENNENR